MGSGCSHNCDGDPATTNEIEQLVYIEATRHAFSPAASSLTSVDAGRTTQNSFVNTLPDISAADGRRFWRQQAGGTSRGASLDWRAVPTYYEISDACYYLGGCCDKFNGVGGGGGGSGDSRYVVCEDRGYSSSPLLCPPGDGNEAGPNTSCLFWTGYRGAEWDQSCDCCTHRQGKYCSKVQWDGSLMQKCCLGQFTDPLSCNPLWSPESPVCADFFETQCNTLVEGTASGWTAGDILVGSTPTLKAGAVHCGEWATLQRLNSNDAGGVKIGLPGNSARLMGKWAEFCAANPSIPECAGFAAAGGTSLPSLQVTTDVMTSLTNAFIPNPVTIVNWGNAPLTLTISGPAGAPSCPLTVPLTNPLAQGVPTALNFDCTSLNGQSTVAYLVDSASQNTLSTLYFFRGSLPDATSYGFSRENTASAYMIMQASTPGSNVN